MWCGVKYTMGHQCVKSQLYQMLVEEPEEHQRENEIFTDCIDTLYEVAKSGDEVPKPLVSLYAMLGTKDSQTMRLQGRTKNIQVVILVDSYSSHNFMDLAIAKRTRCHT